MNYEKKYKEALEIARQFSEHPLQEDSSNIVEYIFPELQDSEDERIRKWLIETIKQVPNNSIEWETIDKSSVLAWLEKQGEKNVADKIKPKFHEGDWVVCGKLFTQITSIENDGYTNSDQGFISFETAKKFHLWTIQDAKDGDVLCTYECAEPKIVFILKGTPKKHYALSYHCYYNIMYPHFASDSEKGCLAPNDEDVKPATKEQRDTLEKAMADAGYTFDFKKKKLKKISQRMVSAEAKEALYDKPAWSEAGEDIKEALRTEYEKGRADVLRCIDPDVMVADFCSQPFSKTRSLASIYRQGFTDIIKRINNNEKTSIIGTRSIDDGGL